MFKTLKNLTSALSGGYKIALVAWVAAFVLITGGGGAIVAISKGKTYTATLEVQDVLKGTRPYKYHAKLKYDSQLFRTQANVSTIKLLNVRYNADINQHSITNFSRINHSVSFESVEDIALGNIAKVEFSISFAPLFKTLAQYFCGGLLVILLLCCLNHFKDEVKQRLCEFFAQPRFLAFFLLSVGIYFVALFALLRGDVNFVDDWQRSMGTGSGWGNFSRFFATYIFKFLNLNKVFVDVSPIPQFVAILVLSLSALMLCFIIRKRIDFLGVLASLPLGLSPYFLENLSYKFDSSIMSFSLLFCIFPFLFRANLRLFAALGTLGVVLALSTYQASNGIFIILSLFLALQSWLFCGKSWREVLRFLAVAVFCFVAAMLIYKTLMVVPVDDVDSYVSDKPLGIAELLKGGNTLTYLAYLHSDLKNMPLFWLAIITASLFVWLWAKDSKRGGVAGAVLAVFYLGVALVLSYGAYLALEKPLFNPRAFMGFGAFVAILSLGIIARKMKFFANYAVVCLVALSLVIFASAYGSAASKMHEYKLFRLGAIATDLARVAPEKSAVVAMGGKAGFLPDAQNTIKTYGALMGRLLGPLTLSGGNMFNEMALTRRLVNHRPENALRCVLDEKWELVLTSQLHDIFKKDECYFVEIKE